MYYTNMFQPMVTNDVVSAKAARASAYAAPPGAVTDTCSCSQCDYNRRTGNGTISTLHAHLQD